MYLEVVAGARGLSASGVRKDPNSAVKVKKIWTLEAKLTSISNSQYNSGKSCSGNVLEAKLTGTSSYSHYISGN